MLALYLLTLGVSAGLTGVFGHRVLEIQGYIPTAFSTDLTLAAGIACVYLATQLLYMTLVRLLYPTRAAGPLVAEMLSHLGALAVVPYLAGVDVAWPHPTLDKVEPLIYLGLFGAIHAFFKLVSFYASIQGRPSGRLGVFGWLAAFFVAAGGGWTVIDAWAKDLSEERPMVAEETNGYRIGDEYARARVVPEGALLTCHLEVYPSPCLTLRWANPPGLDPDEGPLERAYVSAAIEGNVTKRYAATVELRPDGWAEFRVHGSDLPAKAKRCTVSWAMQREPAWRRVTGLGPVTTSGRRLLVAGPFAHEIREGLGKPNIVLVAVEALGADFVSGLGHERETTPTLDALAYGAVAYAHAYTPAPEAPAACMTLLTGLCPLRHGYLGTHRGPLPAEYRTLAEILRDRHYATAAFTEGEGGQDQDMGFGSGFERGFELFNPSCPGDSRQTLEKASAWIDAHADQKFMVFVRLRELHDPRPQARYGKELAQAKGPATLDVYEAALRYVDEQLGAFIRDLRNAETGQNTCIIVTSPYGLDFSAGRHAPPERLLSEACLRVPLYLFAPDLKPARPDGLVSLADVMPTVLELTRPEAKTARDALADVIPALVDPAATGLDYPLDGRTLITLEGTKEPVSMMGKPLVLSMRSEDWRVTWRSNQLPFAGRTRSEGQVVELYDVPSIKKRGAKRNAAARYPELVKHYRAYLNTYLDHRCKPWPKEE